MKIATYANWRSIAVFQKKLERVFSPKCLNLLVVHSLTGYEIYDEKKLKTYQNLSITSVLNWKMHKARFTQKTKLYFWKRLLQNKLQQVTSLTEASQLIYNKSQLTDCVLYKTRFYKKELASRHFLHIISAKNNKTLGSWICIFIISYISLNHTPQLNGTITIQTA